MGGSNGAQLDRGMLVRLIATTGRIAACSEVGATAAIRDIDANRLKCSHDIPDTFATNRR